MRRILLEIPLPFGHYLPIYAFGVLAALGFLVALRVALDRARREKLAEAVIWDVWTASILGGLAGARLVYVLEHWPYYREHLARSFAIWEGGLVWYGGLAGALLAVVTYLRRRRQPVLRVIDALTPATMIGLALGRVGCFLNGCCFGKETDLPWGVSFPRFGGTEHFHTTLAQQFSPPFAYQVEASGLAPRLLASLPVHPTQLYSSVAALLIFLLLTLYYPHRRREGEVFLLMLILYGTARFLIEGLRTNAEVWLGLSLAQLMSLLAVPVALGLFLRSQKKPLPASKVLSDSAAEEGKVPRRRGR